MKFLKNTFDYKSCSVLIDIDYSNTNVSDNGDEILNITLNWIQNEFKLKILNSSLLANGKLIFLITEQLKTDSDQNDDKSLPILTVSIRLYSSDKLITITIETKGNVQLPGNQIVEWNDDYQDEIKMKLKDQFGSFDNLSVVTYPIIKRGGNLPRLLPLSDGRLIEYDFDQLIYETQSVFQNIKIVNSPSFGRTLLLNDVLNLAESDQIYTDYLLRKDCGDNYKDKEVLILGGGDGAALNQLLKDNPKFVTMVEIDKQVMDACRDYMSSICGTVLNQLRGSNYEIMVDDCMPQLETFIKKNQKFDTILNDLTDIPVGANSLNNQQHLWDFVKLVMSQCILCLKPNGICIAHVIGSGATQSIEQYEQMLDNDMPLPIIYKKRQVWVPSFLENWVFFDVRLRQTMESK